MPLKQRGIVQKGGKYYLRTYRRHGEDAESSETTAPGKKIRYREITIPLGKDADGARVACDLVRGALRMGRTPEEIRAALRANRSPLDPAPKGPPARQLTLSQAATRWLKERVEVRMEPRNANMKARRVEGTLVPVLGDRALDGIRRRDCHAYAAHLRETRPDLAPASLGHYLRDLRELLNWCEEVEIVDDFESPWPKGIMPGRAETTHDRLDDEEVETLARLPEPWGFNMRLAVGTGCRFGELCRLDRKDLEVGGLRIRKAKNGRSRVVPVSGTLQKEIMQRTGPLFATRSGGRRSERATSAFNRVIAEMSGIERFHVHLTRHTFACRFLEAGGSLPVLQAILGHSTVAMTQHYGRLGERAIQDEATHVYRVIEAGSGKEPGGPVENEHSTGAAVLG